MLKSTTPVVTGIGVASPLGDAQSAFAAARAGLTRMNDLELYTVQDDLSGEQVPLKACALTGVTDGLGALARLSVLGSLAISDLIDNVSNHTHQFETIPTVVCLSNEVYWYEAHRRELEELKEDLPFDLEQTLEDEINTRLQSYQDNLLLRIESLSGVKLNKTTTVFSTGDQAGFIHVLQQIEENFVANNADSCLVFCLDSLLDERSLENAVKLNLVKDVNNPIGFIPGEAAIALLIERYDQAIKSKANILGALTACVYMHDKANRFDDEAPVTGSILADSINAAATADEMQTTEIDGMIANLNGDIWRAKEWGATLTRLPEKIRELPVQYVTQCFGETGVASAALSLCLAIHRFVRKYAMHDNVLVWVSGDDGGKGAIRVSRIN